MSFKKLEIYPSNPSTSRGTTTKLSSSKDKVIYATGKTVIFRDLKNPSLSTAHSGYAQNVTVARISPSGFYCASADITGKVKIWDIVGEDQVVKGEYRVLSCKINDLSWDGESKRIIAVGDGKEKSGAAFMIDTGTSTGAITGHSKPINAVSIRSQRPFRAVTAGDDAAIIFHSGPPYKNEKTIRTHTNFVQDVRYSPSGDHFVSVGSDSKIFLYEGKTGDLLADVSDSPHKGSIMAASWSPDSKYFFTSALDRTVKLWDAETQKMVTTWTLGSQVHHQQVGNVWNGESNLVSLSLSGDLNIFDPRIGDKPSRILSAPQISINAITQATNTFLTGTVDGRVYAYSDNAERESRLVQGPTHANSVCGLTSDEKAVYSIGFDDHVREILPDGTSFLPTAVPTSTQPKSIAVAGDSTVFVIEVGAVEAFRANQKVFQQNPPYQPSAVDAGGNLVVLGEDKKVHLHEWDGKALKEVAVLEGNPGQITALAFSPNGKYLASGDSSGKIVLFDAEEKKVLYSRWSSHTARINSISWTADSAHLVSGSLDTHAYVWSVKYLSKVIAIRNAGPGGVNGVLWLDGGKEGRLVSTGYDAVVRIWQVKFHV